MATISQINGLIIKDATARTAHDSLANAVENMANELNSTFQSIDLEFDETIKQIQMGGVSYTPSNDGIVRLPDFSFPEGETLSTSIILSSGGWVDNTQTITGIKGVTANNNIFVAPAGNPKVYAEAGIYCSAQGTNSLTFVCETVPTENITVNIQIDTDGVGGWEYVGKTSQTDGGWVNFTGPGSLDGDSYLLLICYGVHDGQSKYTPIVTFLVKNGDDPVTCENFYLNRSNATEQVYSSIVELTEGKLTINTYDGDGNRLDPYANEAHNIKVFKCKLPSISES